LSRVSVACNHFARFHVFYECILVSEERLQSFMDLLRSDHQTISHHIKKIQLKTWNGCAVLPGLLQKAGATAVTDLHIFVHPGGPLTPLYAPPFSEITNLRFAWPVWESEQPDPIYCAETLSFLSLFRKLESLCISENRVPNSWYNEEYTYPELACLSTLTEVYLYSVVSRG
jgi:hypothetical protein